MSKTRLAPYFHPTQIVLVDDDIDFLGNLSLQLEADLPYLLFDSTEKALAYINDRDDESPSRQRFFRLENEQEGRRHVTLDTDALAREMHFTNRFSRISIAMIDYAMPRMNGLEFCRRIRDPHIKKILFTGVATETEAVEGFNDGVIDRYIRKSEHNVYEHLNRTIRELQHAHILETFKTAIDVFDIEMPPLLGDEAIAELLGTLRSRYEFVEYYMVFNPTGFLLIDGDGELYRLVIVDELEQQALVDQAAALGAPAECVRLLRSGENLLDPAFMSRAQNVTSDAYRHWKSHMRVAECINGARNYRWAVFESDPGEHGMSRPRSTFNRYLEWLDTMGYSLM